MMPIERMRPEDFDAVFRLLARSFPAGERRDKAGQRALLADSAYHIDILRAPSGGVQALMASWDFGGFVFFEHFAVDPACRNGGIGGQMLDALLERPATAGVRALTTTITEANTASWRLFESLARRRGASFARAVRFDRATHFAGLHDTEFEVTIGLPRPVTEPARKDIS